MCFKIKEVISPIDIPIKIEHIDSVTKLIDILIISSKSIRFSVVLIFFGFKGKSFKSSLMALYNNIETESLTIPSPNKTEFSVSYLSSLINVYTAIESVAQSTLAYKI